MAALVKASTRVLMPLFGLTWPMKPNTIGRSGRSGGAPVIRSTGNLITDRREPFRCTPRASCSSNTAWESDVISSGGWRSSSRRRSRRMAAQGGPQVSWWRWRRFVRAHSNQ